MKLIAIESPFSGTPAIVSRNLRYLAWCIRYVYSEGHAAYAGHAVGPLGCGEDDIERTHGLNADAFVRERCDETWAFIDLGITKGMVHMKSKSRCSWFEVKLSEAAPSYWLAFERGEYPPGTVRAIPVEDWGNMRPGGVDLE